MRRILLALLAIVLTALACSKAPVLTPTMSVNTVDTAVATVNTFTPVSTLTPTAVSTLTPTSTPVPVIVLAETLNCRERADTESRVLAVLPGGARYEVLTVEGEWYQVLPAPGAPRCWIYRDWTVDE